MDSLEHDYVKKRKIYREIFLKAKDALLQQLSPLNPPYECDKCTFECKFSSKNDLLMSKVNKDCTYKDWQKNALEKLKNGISKDILDKISLMLAYKETFKCNRCALCCRFACSEFSYSELKIKAENGDNFASQFISVFVPYDNLEEAFKVYPQYIELLKDKYGEIKDIYFYYCPKLSDNNTCTDYENRPDICRDFPNNALAILPDSCGYKPWKEEMEIMSLTLNALSEIVCFYIEKLEDNLKSS